MITRLWCKWFGHHYDVIDNATVSWVYCKRCTKYLRILEK